VTANRTPTPQRISDLPPLARTSYIVWFVIHSASPLVWFGLFLTVVLNSSVGGYVALIWLSTDLVLGYVMRGATFLAIGELDDLSERERLWLSTGVGFLGVTLLGVFLTPTGSNAVAVIIVVGLIGHLSCHVGAALASYRRVMARPWPAVAALTDDDDWL
jgi:uncharacterized membrane protein